MLQDGLHTALDSLQQDPTAKLGLLSLLKFLAKKLNSENTASVLDYVLEEVLNLDLDLESPEVIEVLEAIRGGVENEIETQGARLELTQIVHNL